MGSEVVGRLCRRFGTGWETQPEVRNWSGDPPGSPELVGVSPVGLQVVGGYPGGPEMVGRPSRMSGRGRDILSEVRRWLGDPPGRS